MYGYSVCILMLALMSRAAVATPLRATGSAENVHANCTARARDLLFTLKGVFDKTEKMGSNTLFHGFNCTDLGAVVNPKTQTAIVCQPIQDVKCSGQNIPPFSEITCLQNIANDLEYHRSMLIEYVSTLDPKANSQSVKELKLITASIDNLKNCKLLPNPEASKQKWSSTHSFEDRKDLCKQLKGFHLRTITINRVLGFICAGDYNK